MSTLIAIAYPDRDTAEQVRQELTSALLPAPAPAASSVSGCSNPRSSSSVRRPRGTHPGGGRGGSNFVASSGSSSALGDTDQPGGRQLRPGLGACAAAG